MNYSKSQYQEMVVRFNKLGLDGKLLLVKMNQDIFKLEHYKEDWYNLHLVDDEAMQLELDFLFELPNEIDKDKLTDLGL